MKLENCLTYALQNKLRFETPRGQITTEQLFDLPLTSNNGISLDSVSETVLNEQAKAPRKSLVVATNSANNIIANIKIAILEVAITTRQAKLDAKALAQHNITRIAKLKEALLVKDEKALGKLSRKEMQAELATLVA